MFTNQMSAMFLLYIVKTHREIIDSVYDLIFYQYMTFTVNGQ